MDSDSSLSSPPATEDEMELLEAVKPTPQKKPKKNGNILSFFKSPSPVRKKRPASPPHEPVPEDNPDIAFIVMFRSRFSEAFPPKTPHFGPQDIERGVSDIVPSPQIDTLLRALLGLLLNRKKPIEKGHHGRALEEAILGHRSQWPRAWNGVNPLSGGRSFDTMTYTERITLLKNLVLWCLHDSEVVNQMIKDGYKSRTSRDKTDTNIPLSVQPWGRDGDNRRYWLIEGQDDTAFRVYRESNPKLKTVTWWSVAGSIEEISALATKLEDEDGTREAKLLAEKMRNAIPRFEATEAKRKRRQYNYMHKQRLVQPSYITYEGRLRGKRAKYTDDVDDDVLAELELPTRRSTRNSRRETPAASGPTVTASGRLSKSRATGFYGEALHSGQQVDGPADSEDEEPRGRATRAHANGWRPKPNRNIDRYNSEDEDMEEDDDVTSWDGGDDEEEPDHMDVDDEDGSLDATSEDDEPKSLLVRLRLPHGVKLPSEDELLPKQEVNGFEHTHHSPPMEDKKEPAIQAANGTPPLPQPTSTSTVPTLPQAPSTTPHQPLTLLQSPQKQSAVLSGAPYQQHLVEEQSTGLPGAPIQHPLAGKQPAEATLPSKPPILPTPQHTENPFSNFPHDALPPPTSNNPA
ncbi:hypothetical protein M011DRAFT_396727 [Sporormia fimetaria CBS 119925]|uniref:WHIM1 domain-containing protein n=1 Tax=Sporormia fimetaria CBS 119925 TaxID=1340428 RepID=A0A6A6VMG5_9PLEO|nr:hypothetical protein M011DRAFT_396727 [Sporormia fimetaria CBS 119925]